MNKEGEIQRIKRERRLVPESAICYAGQAFICEQFGHEFIVICESEEALNFAWAFLGSTKELDPEQVKKLATFDYGATK